MSLTYEVLVNDGVRRAREERLPDGGPIISSPVSSVLVLGEHDAVLVDPPFTYEQIDHVGDWIERSGRRLAYIYATHGHGDHWFGADRILRRFPGAVAYATERTIEMMHRQATVGRAERWDVDFPGLIPDSPVVFQPIPAGGFTVEGHRFEAVEVGHTDTDDTTVLHVPSIGLVVAGDVAYNGVHQYLLESLGDGFKTWLDALDTVEALRPRAVVAGHKNRELPDDPAILGRTRQYLLDAQRLLDDKPTPREFFDRMLALHPNRLNPGPVWYGALGLLSVQAEVTAWFFDDYLATWVGVANGTIDKGPDFILDYWGAPLSTSHPDPDRGEWRLDSEAVVGLLAAMHTRLRADGYAHTEIVDRSVRVYHRNGAAIEVIWSRRRADGTEIERLAVHFEVIRTDRGWRIAGIQATPTAADELTDAWGER